MDVVFGFATLAEGAKEVEFGAVGAFAAFSAVPLLGDLWPRRGLLWAVHGYGGRIKKKMECEGCVRMEEKDG